MRLAVLDQVSAPQEIAAAVERAEFACAAAWPVGTAMRAWLAGQCGAPADLAPDVERDGTGLLHGRVDVIASRSPDALLVRGAPDTGAPWWRVAPPAIPAVPLVDRRVRRFVGELDDRPAAAATPVDLPTDLAERAGALLALVTAAAQVGVAQRALDLAVHHAGVREQFGRPIGTFQSVAHRLADMYCTVELARSAVVLAAAAGVGPLGAPDAVAAASAQLLAATTLPGVVEQAIHVHGAVGLTEDLPLHVLLRRALLLRALGGGPGGAVGRLLPRLDALARLAPTDASGGIT